jgi:hypothetical protein
MDQPNPLHILVSPATGKTLPYHTLVLRSCGFFVLAFMRSGWQIMKTRMCLHASRRKWSLRE